MTRSHFARLAIFCSLTLWQPAAFGREAGWAPIDSPQKIARQHGIAKKKAAPRPGRELKAARRATVYDNQPPVTEREINAFVAVLPGFRAWARQNGEQAHPVLNAEGEPDFAFSGKAASWVREHEFEPSRFFCILGRMAAAAVIVEEGNDLPGARPADMPPVAQEEIGLARKHLGSLLRAGAPAQPIK